MGSHWCEAGQEVKELVGLVGEAPWDALVLEVDEMEP
jgi:hypothetical protein